MAGKIVEVDKERCNFEDNYEEMVIFYGALAEENEILIKENEELIQ